MVDGCDENGASVPRSVRRKAWSDIPELWHVEEARAKVVYECALNRAGRDWRTWAALGVAVGLGAAYALFAPDVRVRTSKFPVLLEVVNVVMNGLVSFGAVLLYFRLIRSTLRRCVRAELGTHCSACDYDLRATPDVPCPDVARCPECGKAVPRDVDRRTLPRGDGDGHGDGHGPRGASDHPG
jgi:hypothetical protein